MYNYFSIVVKCRIPWQQVVLQLLRKKRSRSVIACDFEVFGTVQGVFFRKHTQQQATKLNLVGWVKNASSGTVQGHMEGRKDRY